MFKYKIDVIEELRKRGYTAPFIRKHNIFGESSMSKIRHGEVLGINYLDKLCSIFECQLSDIVEHIPDDIPPRPGE